MASDEHTVTVRVIVFKEGDQWVAQCLEHDIGAQAPTIDALQVRLKVALNAELKESLERSGAPFTGIAAAPERFQLMWEHRARSVEMNPVGLEAIVNKPVALDFGLVA